MKKILSSLIVFSFLFPSMGIASEKLATVFNPITGVKKVVTVGAPNVFAGGFKLLTKNIGAIITTGFQTRLTNSITSSATTIYVSKTTDINGTQLPITSINKAYFNLEPGSSRQEPIVCTGVTPTSFTGCTRGLVATGMSETSSSSAAFSHNAGSTIILTNISQFYNAFVDSTNNQDINGVKNFLQLPTSTTTNPTLSSQLTTKSYVDGVAVSGAPNATESVKGISELATGNEAASSTSSGATGARLVLPASLSTSTGGIAKTIPVTGVNGLLDPVFYQGNNNTWSGTNTFSGQVNGLNSFGSFGDGSDGDIIISASTTLYRDYYYNNLTINSGVVVNPNGYRIFVKNTLTFVGTGKIALNGGNGGNGGDGTTNSTGGVAGGTAGLAASSTATSTLPRATSGSVGGNNGPQNGSVVNISLAIGTSSVSGGAGSNGFRVGSGVSAGGTSATGTITESSNKPRTIYQAFSVLYDFFSPFATTSVSAGTGSGGGGGSYYDNVSNEDSGGSGGGSGGSGGCILVSARNIITVDGNIFIEAKGGTGGNGGNSYSGNPTQTGAGGGGAGGSGGVVILIYNNKTNNGTINVSGGIGGVGGTGGYSGSTAGSGNTGKTGIIYYINN